MKTIHRIILSSFVATCFCLEPLVASAQDAKPGAAPKTEQQGNLKSKDAKFLRDMAENNLLEIRIGQLAQQKSQNDQVKAFAQKLVQDQTKANQDLTQIAQSKGVTLPMQLDKRHERTVENLSSLSGNDFDRAFLRRMERDDRSDVRKLESESKRAADADVKQFASTTLPVVQDHLSRERTLYSQTSKTISEPAGANKQGKSGKQY